MVCPKCQCRFGAERNSRGEVETIYGIDYELCKEVDVKKIMAEGGRLQKCPTMERTIQMAIEDGRV